MRATMTALADKTLTGWMEQPCRKALDLPSAAMLMQIPPIAGLICRRRMPPAHRGALLGRRPPGLLAYLRQVTHVVAPLRVGRRCEVRNDHQRDSDNKKFHKSLCWAGCGRPLLPSSRCFFDAVRLNAYVAEWQT